jgi:signal transduction histidine kinase
VIEVRAVKSADVVPAGRRSLIFQDRTRDFMLLETLASKEALASLGQAAATLAHEIRNPLTAILSSADCIAQDVESGRPPERRHAQLVHAEVGRLNELLERTLQFSRPLELRREPVDVSDLLRRAVERLQAPNGRLMTDQATDLPPVSSDPDLLFQVFGNLLRNGIEAAREVLASTRRDGNCVIVRVLSRGARIPPEIEARLFQPFVTSKPHGTGLGLALCRKIATAHDAEIDGRNCDEGVLFELRLPA